MPSLAFTTGGQELDCGSNAVLDNIAAGTIVAWVYPTSVTDPTQRICAKGTGQGPRLRVRDGADGNLNVRVGRATVSLEATSAASVLSNNSWQFVAAHWDVNGVDADQELFHGTLSALATEVSSYTTQQVGSGAQTDDSAANLIIGNDEDGGEEFEGRIAVLGVWNRRLSLGELRAQQFFPHKTSGCVGLWFPGRNGTGTQADYSGNFGAGTVTGATAAPGVPIPILRHPAGLLYNSGGAAAGGGLGIPLAMYHRLRQAGA